MMQSRLSPTSQVSTVILSMSMNLLRVMLVNADLTVGPGHDTTFDRVRSESPLSSAPGSPPPPPVESQRPKRAPRPSYLEGSDSELTDLSESDERSDDEAVPQPASSRVKTTTKSAKSKKSKSKKKSKKRSKGKGKARAVDSDSEDDDERPAKPKGKKPLIAKAAYWHDIPEWEEGSDSPLMNMPAEIMDNIFGFRPELRVSTDSLL